MMTGDYVIEDAEKRKKRRVHRVKSDSRNLISHSKMTQSILEPIINCTIRGIISNIQVNWDSCIHEGQLSHPKSVGTGEGGEMMRRR